MAHVLSNPPSFIERKPCRFLIMDAPTDTNLPAYLAEMKRYGVHTVVRACEPSYSTEPLKREGVDVREMAFDDGSPPPPEVIEDFMSLVRDEFGAHGKEERAIAVHCVAGLGRAPVLVAIALIELCNMDPFDAVALIRSKRRGAINARQLDWIERYKPASQGCCLIC
ncbi:MAG: hypothetical protein MHM6MM_007813 [Cercozoa sp. M6MM]